MKILKFHFYVGIICLNLQSVQLHMNYYLLNFFFCFSFGPRFPPMSKAYDREYRKLAKKIAEELGYTQYLREGVYCSLGGPCYETVTECRFLKTAGADAVGKLKLCQISSQNVLLLIYQVCLQITRIGMVACKHTHNPIISWARY